MTHKKFDSVQQYATGTGAGALSLQAATSAKFQTLQTAGLANGDTFYARAQNETIDAEWEFCLWTYSAGTITPTLDAKSITATGSLISFSAGNKIISGAIGSKQAVTEDLNGDAIVTRNLTVTGKFNAGMNPFPPVGRRCLLMGDSITQNCFTNTGSYPANIVAHQNDSWFSWANRLTGHRLSHSLSLNKGIGGNTTAQMVARFATDVLANIDLFDILILQGGTNDADTGVLASVSSANIMSMASQVLALGKYVIIMLPPPFGSVASIPSAQTLNMTSMATKIKEWAKGTPGVILVDPMRSMVDYSSGTNGNCLAVLQHGDGIHPSGGGAYRMGRKLADAINVLLPPGPDVISSAADIYDATNNITGNRMPNGCFNTASGGTLSNGTGTVAGSMQVQKLSGTWINSEVVVSVVNGASGVDAPPGNKQHIVVSMGARTSDEGFYLINAAAITTFVPGDIIVGEVEMDISSFTNMWYAHIGIMDSDGSNFPFNCWDGYDPYGPASTNLNLWDPQTLTGLVFRTPAYTVLHGAGMYLKAEFRFNSTVSATATIDVKGMTIRKIG